MNRESGDRGDSSMTAAKIASVLAFQSLVRVPRPRASRLAHALFAMTPLDNSLSLARPLEDRSRSDRRTRETWRERIEKGTTKPGIGIYYYIVLFKEDRARKSAYR